ncbi:MAG: oligopeptide:H+ symporter [bacterium]
MPELKQKFPKPFYILFSIEMWERFGYYGIQALLVLFMVKHLKFSDIQADNTFSAFAALVYAFVCVGGYIGDKLLGNRRTLLIGAVVLAMGYLILGLNSEKFLYLSLGIIVAGNALFKSNPSTLISKLYQTNDHQVDSAFTVYYMAINIGSFISMSFCPLIEKIWGWNWAFLVSFLGMVVAILNYIMFSRYFRHLGSPPDFKPLKIINLLIVIITTVVIALISTWLLGHLAVTHTILFIALIAVGLLFVKEILKSNPSERIKLIISAILIGEAIIFFILYQQMPTSINLFAQRNTTHQLLGIQIEPATFQALNPMWIMLLSPLLAIIYTRLGRKNRDMSLPGKFALGMLFCSLGFLSLYIASIFFANHKGLISGNWLILSYGMQSTGELLVSGLGLAMIARLTPQRVMGFMMGAWFMSTSIAMLLGGYVADLANIPENITSSQISLNIYSSLFFKIGLASLIISLIMFLFVPKLKKHLKT